MTQEDFQRAHQLHEYIQHIQWMLNDFNENGAEVATAHYDKYAEDFQNTFANDEDTLTKEALKEAVIEVLNIRLAEISKEIESL